MRYLVDALAWIADPARWPGPDGIGTRLAEHFGYSVVGVLIEVPVMLGLVRICTRTAHWFPAKTD